VAGTVAVIEPENLTFFHTGYVPDCTIKDIYQKKALEIFFQASLCTFQGFVPHHESKKFCKNSFPIKRPGYHVHEIRKFSGKNIRNFLFMICREKKDQNRFGSVSMSIITGRV
jgi:hypothetical protein